MLRRFNPFEEMSSLFQSFDNLFRQYLDWDEGFAPSRLLTSSTGSGTELAPTRSSTWSRWSYPAVDSFRRGDEIVLRAELPGIDPNELEMTVVDNRLVIRGEKKEERTSEENTDVLFREVFHGRFERSFALPKGVKAEQITARYQNGVLEVTLPAQGLEVAGRKVPIQIGAGEPSGKKTIKSA